jgi:hypothetical protein
MPEYNGVAVAPPVPVINISDDDDQREVFIVRFTGEMFLEYDELSGCAPASNEVELV